MARERQVWEDKYKMDTGKQSQKIVKLRFELIAEKIGRAELRAENQSIRDALHAMEQSLVEHENYIDELREENAYQNVMYERALVEIDMDRKAWKAQ